VTAPPWLRALHVEHLNSDNQPLPLWNPVRVRFHGLELIPTSSSVSMWSCSLIWQSVPLGRWKVAMSSSQSN